MLLITFSGLDGCGKTTHVALTADFLCGQGYRVRELVTLHVSATGVWARLGEGWRKLARRASPSPPSPRPATPRIRTYAKGRTFAEDRRHWAVRLRRMIVYPLDCVVLSVTIGWLRLLGYEAIVCDRYTFDKMVGLPNPDCFLSRLMRRLAPQPDRAFFLDASPDAAGQRKPEHHYDYYVTKYAGYRRMVEMDCGLQSIPSTTIEQTQACVEAAIAPVVRQEFACLSACRTAKS